MSTARLYYITKTLLSFGLDELIPRKKIPWFATLARGSLFWLRNQHKDKPAEYTGLKLHLTKDSSRMVLQRTDFQRTDSFSNHIF